MEVQVKEISLQTTNGYAIAVSKFIAKKESSHAIVISSATGVLQKYYANFAHFCASNGVTVYTFDYSGIGKSDASPIHLKNPLVTLTSWGENDQASVIALAKEENPNANLTLITHSIGGQILGFNGNHHLLDKVLMVASQGGYWKGFKGIHKLKMWLFWYFLIPVLTKPFGYFPAKKLGLFENLPKHMVYEWASWGKKKKYMMLSENTRQLLTKVKLPILMWSFPKDSFAPKELVDWLANQYENSEITRRHYSQSEPNQPGHFGFFKSRFKDAFWQQNLNWILNDTLS